MLAALLLTIELPVVLALAVLVLCARFAGLVPWSVLILDGVTGEQRHESYRWFRGAIARVRSINRDRRVRVRWAWT